VIQNLIKFELVVVELLYCEPHAFGWGGPVGDPAHMLIQHVSQLLCLLKKVACDCNVVHNAHSDQVPQRRCLWYQSYTAVMVSHPPPNRNGVSSSTPAQLAPFTASTQNFRIPPLKMPHASQAVCHQFQNSGFCSYGSNCKFSHDGNIINRAHQRHGKKVSIPKKCGSFYLRLAA
jgi:hypothetical protein